MGAFREFFEELFDKVIVTPLKALIEVIIKVEDKIRDGFYINAIENTKTVDALMGKWEKTPQFVKEDEQIKEAYKAKKEELEALGMNTASDLVLGVLGKQIAGAIWHVEKTALPKIMDWIDTFAEAYKMEREDRENLKVLAKSGEFGLNAVVNFVLGVTLYPAVMTAGAPAWEKAGQEAYKALPVTLADLGSLIRLKYREEIDESLYEEQLRKQGISDVVQKILEDAYLFYPSPADLVTWQAKEVYEPKMVEKYGLENELEDLEKEAFYKAGMNDEQIRNFWVAHWEHPSWTVIREMLFRTDLEEADVWEWFKTVEIPPFWRDKFIAVAYSPLTRVDLRRMYQDEVIDRDEVYKGYIELGSKPEHAEWLTTWTEVHYPPKRKELTKTEILKNYRIGKAAKDVAIKLLSELDYEEAEIIWLLEYEDYKLAEEEKKTAAETLVTEVLEGKLAFEELQKKLSELGLNEKEVRTYWNKAKTELRKRVKTPPEAVITRWYKTNIITEDNYRKRLKLMNYSPEDIENYVKEGKK